MCIQGEVTRLSPKTHHMTHYCHTTVLDALDFWLRFEDVYVILVLLECLYLW